MVHDTMLRSIQILGTKVIPLVRAIETQ